MPLIQTVGKWSMCPSFLKVVLKLELIFVGVGFWCVYLFGQSCNCQIEKNKLYINYFPYPGDISLS